MNDVRHFDSVIFLGDAVSPGPQTLETMELLRSLTGWLIRGNHEDSLLDSASTAEWPDGFKAIMDWTRGIFTDDDCRFLNSFSHGGEFPIDGSNLVLAHGDESLAIRHVLPDTADDDFRALAYSSAFPRILFGHSHVQFTKRIGDQEFINPGSVGQNRCGQVVACYGLLTDGEYTHHHVAYDLEPWLDAIDQLDCLESYESFRQFFKDSMLSGFGAGKRQPWEGLASRGYR